MTMLEHALRYAEHGWHIFPVHSVINGVCTCGDADCSRPGKHPRTAKGFLNASDSIKKVTYWWTQWPDANIGVSCGPSGLAALDVDVQHLASAEAFLAALTVPTPKAETGGGGLHLIYAAPRESYPSSQTLFSPVEYKGSNGTFTVAPSRHASGNEYRWVVSPFDMAPAPLPRHIVDVLAEAARERAVAQARAAERRAQLMVDAPADMREVADALTAIPAQLHYTEWIKVLMAVHSAFPGEDGIALCEAWSPGRSGEIAGEFRRWDRKETHTNIDTVFWLARQHGWTPAPKAKAKPEPQRALNAEVFDMPDPSTLVAESGPDERPHSTWPYAVHNDRLSIMKEKKEDGETIIEFQPLAEFTARITQQIDDEGTRTYVVEGTAIRGGDFLLEIDAEEFGASARLAAKLDAAAGAQSPILPGKANHVGPAIKLLSANPSRIQRFKRVGWSDDTTGLYLLPGRRLPNDMVVELPAQMSHYGIHPDADPQVGVLLLDKLIASLDPNYTTVALSHMLGAPLGRIINLRRHALFVRGQSGSLKTSWCQAAMCLYGDFVDDAALIKFGSGATYNALVALVAVASDAPVLIDNFKPNTKQAEDFVSLIHMILEGRERNRLTQTLELRDARDIHAWPVITGEDVPDSDAASLARMLVVPFASRRDAGLNEKLYDVQFQALHLSAVGAAWIEWLEKDGAEVARRIAEDYQSTRMRWALAMRNDEAVAMNPLRIADNLATNEIVYRIAMEHPLFGYVFRQYEAEHRAGLHATASYMAETTSEASEVTRWLTMIKAMLVDGTVTLLPADGIVLDYDRERMIGWQDKNTVYIYSPNAMKHITRQFGQGALSGMSDRQIWQQLDGLGMFVEGKPAKPTQKRIGGTVHRVLWLDREQFEGQGDERSVADIVSELELTL